MNIVKKLNLPKDLEARIDIITTTLKDNGTYSPALDLQILNCASLLLCYQKLITAVSTEDTYITKYIKGVQVTVLNPVYKEFSNISTTLMRSMKELNLTLNLTNSGAAPINANDGMSVLMKKMSKVG